MIVLYARYKLKMYYWLQLEMVMGSYIFWRVFKKS